MRAYFLWHRLSAFIAWGDLNVKELICQSLIRNKYKAAIDIAPLDAYTCGMTTLTPSQRVARSNHALLARGGRRVPSGYFQPATALALSELVAAGYAPSPLAVICAALLDAQRKVKQ